MSSKLNIESFIGKTTFIVGSDKHAGKTTFLNYVLKNKADSGVNYVYLSIGIDGEGKDVLTGMPKPKVYAEKGAYIVTTESALRSSDALFEIREFINIRTPLGYLALVKVLRPGNIELVGPETNSQLQDLLAKLRNQFDISTILVDGAVDRLSQVTTEDNSQFVYVVSVTPQNLSRIIEKILFIYQLSLIDTADNKNIDKEKTHFVKGLLNKQTKGLIPEKTETIIVNDLSCIFLSFVDLTNLLNNYEVYYLKKYFLKSFIINLKDVDKELLIKRLKEKSDFNSDLLVFNPYVAEL